MQPQNGPQKPSTIAASMTMIERRQVRTAAWTSSGCGFRQARKQRRRITNPNSAHRASQLALLSWLSLRNVAVMDEIGGGDQLPGPTSIIAIPSARPSSVTLRGLATGKYSDADDVESHAGGQQPFSVVHGRGLTPSAAVARLIPKQHVEHAATAHHQRTQRSVRFRPPS